MAAESLTSPRPPETDGVSGRTFAKVRGRFNRSLANRKTTRGKRAGRWRAVVWPHLHIDDGSMGGGGPIMHYKDYLYFGVKDPNNNDPPSGSGEYNDFYDVKSNYFDNNRNGMFHYCIFGHYFSWWKDGQERKGTYKAAGTGIYSGGHFFLGDKRIHEINPDHVSGQQANTFMHELGHALGLDDYEGGSESSMGGAPSTKVGYGTAWGDLEIDFSL